MSKVSSVPVATSSDLPPMQPRSVFGILGAAISVYARFPLLLLGIIVPLELPLAVVNSVMAASSPINGLSAAQIYTRANLIALFLYAFIRLLLVLVEVVVSFVVLAAVTRVIAARYLGQPTSIFAAYRSVAPRFMALLGGMLAVVGAGIISLVFAAILAVFLVLIILQVDADKSFTPGEGGLSPLLAPAVYASLPPIAIVGYLLMRWSMVVQVVMVEQTPGNQSLRRSWRLVGGRFWQVTITLLLAVGPAVLLTLAPLIVSLLTTSDQGWLNLGFDLLAYLLRVALLPFGFVALVLLYFDLRIRKENYNLSALAAELSAKQGTRA
jgi:hypothetical protein